jgi:hypothetical protein
MRTAEDTSALGLTMYSNELRVVAERDATAIGELTPPGRESWVAEPAHATRMTVP